MLLKCEIPQKCRKAGYRGALQIHERTFGHRVRVKHGGSDQARDTHGRVSPMWAPREAGSCWAGGCHLQSLSGLGPLTSSRLLSISVTVLREARVFTFMS